MYVRVYDKAFDRHYKSIVYSIVNVGFHRQFIVLNPHERRFELVPELDKSTKEYRPLVDYIRLDTEDWVEYKNATLLKYKHFCRGHGKDDTIDFLWGYRDVCENFKFISEMLENKALPQEGSDILLRELEDMEDWHYILTQQDADDFMKLFVGFHDASLTRLVYEEQPYMSNAVATFDNSGWYGIVEICFERVVAINIRPAAANYSPEIYDASLIVKDEAIFWADDYMKEEDLSYEGTYIKAYSMKWRKIG